MSKIIYTKVKIPLIYSNANWIRIDNITYCDCLEDMKYIEELKSVYTNSIDINSIESFYSDGEIILALEIENSILTRSGETNDLIKFKKYYWKIHDVFYVIKDKMAGGSVSIDSTNLDLSILIDLETDKSAIDYLKAYKVFEDVEHLWIEESEIDIFEKKLLARRKIREIKGLKKSFISKRKNRRINISNKLRKKILERDKHKCFKCGNASLTVPLEIDHIVPVSLIKKLNLPEKLNISEFNLITLCFNCNQGKKDYLNIEEINFYLDRFKNHSKFVSLIEYLSLIKRLQSL